MCNFIPRLDYDHRVRVLTQTEIYVTGDLAWLATMLGKEGMSPHWCHICMLAKESWSKEGHSKGESWKLQKIIDMVIQNKKGTDRKGVKIRP